MARRLPRASTLQLSREQPLQHTQQLTHRQGRGCDQQRQNRRLRAAQHSVHGSAAVRRTDTSQPADTHSLLLPHHVLLRSSCTTASAGRCGAPSAASRTQHTAAAFATTASCWWREGRTASCRCGCGGGGLQGCCWPGAAAGVLLLRGGGVVQHLQQVVPAPVSGAWPERAVALRQANWQGSPQNQQQRGCPRNHTCTHDAQQPLSLLLHAGV